MAVQRALGLLGLVWMVPLVCLLWLSGQPQITIQRLTVDMPTLAGVPPHTSLISNSGVVLWLVTGWVLLLVCLNCKPARARLFVPALFTLLLGIDDGLMLHESLLPSLLRADSHVVQPALYACYLVFLGISLRQQRLHAWSLLLAAGLVCLGGSLFLDVLQESDWLPGHHRLHQDAGFAMLLEDGLKWLGIIAWATYWQIQAVREIKRCCSCECQAEQHPLN